MKQVSLVQFPADEANGVVDIYVAQSKLMRLTYSAETLLAQFEACTKAARWSNCGCGCGCCAG